MTGSTWGMKGAAAKLLSAAILISFGTNHGLESSTCAVSHTRRTLHGLSDERTVPKVAERRRKRFGTDLAITKLPIS